MKYALLFLLLASTASALLLSDYPQLFVTSGKFHAYYVVGEEANALDVISATIISTSLARYPNITTDIATSRVDSDILDITAINAIVIGSPCDNKAAATLEGNPNPCYKNLGGGVAYIKLFEHGSAAQLLITGLTPQDREEAARYLAQNNLDTLKVRTFIIPTHTGSTPPFFEQKNTNVNNTRTTNATTENETPPAPEPAIINTAPLAEPKETASPQKPKPGPYEPLREIPKEKGFFERLWEWFKSLFA